MEIIGYLRMTLESTGRIEGHSNDSKHLREIPVASYSYDINAPIAVATGLSTGNRRHGEVTCEIDASDPSLTALLQGVTTNDAIKRAVLDIVARYSRDTELTFEFEGGVISHSGKEKQPTRRP